jgi:hypothetical protein
LRPLSLAFALFLGLSIASGAAAKATQCKDAKGKFIKCPPAAAAPVTPAASTRCKDAKGKFTKCPPPAAATPVAPATPAATTRCKDAQGRFTKCSPPAATPTASAPTMSGGPAGATAKCKDGTFSSSKTHSGSCSHHGGVAAWLH